MTFKDFVDGLINLGNVVVIPVIFTLAFLVFVWGLFKYFIWGAENEEERSNGRRFLFWGALGMAILFSVWGLVNVLLSTLGFAR